MIRKLCLSATVGLSLIASAASAAPRSLQDGGRFIEASASSGPGDRYYDLDEDSRRDGGRVYSDEGRSPQARRLASNNPEDLSLGREAPQSTRAVVPDPTGEAPGVITVDTANRYLYLSLQDGKAVRYDIGVGRQGFEWSGVARVGRKAEWPGWTPPAAMLKRRPDLPSHMQGGIDNPLGARALYLYSGNRDTMFRIHGSNEPWTIGEAVSSGCIRMLNDDVIDLYDRVRVGATVKVLG